MTETRGTVTFRVSITMQGPIGDLAEENADEELRYVLAEALNQCSEVVTYQVEDAIIEEED